MSDLEKERSLTSTEVAELLVKGMIAGIEKETPPPGCEGIINVARQWRASRERLKELEELERRGKNEQEIHKR